MYDSVSSRNFAYWRLTRASSSWDALKSLRSHKTSYSLSRARFLEPELSSERVDGAKERIEAEEEGGGPMMDLARTEEVSVGGGDGARSGSGRLGRTAITTSARLTGGSDGNIGRAPSLEEEPASLAPETICLTDARAFPTPLRFFGLATASSTGTTSTASVSVLGTWTECVHFCFICAQR
jgi:hypothetical protein